MEMWRNTTHLIPTLIDLSAMWILRVTPSLLTSLFGAKMNILIEPFYDIKRISHSWHTGHLTDAISFFK